MDFARPGQTDWAVLCSVGRVSSVLVFWTGSETNPALNALAEEAQLRGFFLGFDIRFLFA
jgi:hypothetical protein